MGADMKTTSLILSMAVLAASSPVFAESAAPASSKQAAPAAKATIALSPEERAKADHYFDCYKQLREVLGTIEDAASADAAVDKLDKLNDEFDAFLALPPAETKLYVTYFQTERLDEMDDIYAGYRGEYLRIADSDLLFENEGLVYELIIRRNPAGYYFQDAEMIVSVLLSPSSNKKPDPALAQFRKELTAKHAAEHTQIMEAQADKYAGGDGTSEATAIDLLPFTEGKADSDKDRELLTKLINEYLGTVYPDSGTAFGFHQASPDGSFHHIREIIYGLYTGADGKRHLKTQTVFFRTKKPRK